MTSNSALTINWLVPDLEEERWEFFNHPDKQEWYRLHNVSWEQLVSNFDAGRMIQYPRSGRIGDVPVSLSYHKYSDYQKYLARAKRGYRRNYSLMEDDLQNSGSLDIKAPVILSSNGDGLLFSGYRRLCLAWNYGMIPYIWLVDVSKSQED